MQKSTFKIATKFERKNRLDDLQPIEYQEVEGYIIGNWGITNIVPTGDNWTIYHTIKGMRLSLYYFEWVNAIKALEITAKLFGENHNGVNTAASREALRQWERDLHDLAARECLYFDDELG